MSTRLLLGFQLYALRQTGFLYWSMLRKLAVGKPLDTVQLVRGGSPCLPTEEWSVSSNTSLTTATGYEVQGDGDLYYPGSEGPLHSLRSVALRDGVEEWLYLQQLEDISGGPSRGLRFGAVAAAGLRRHTSDAGVLLGVRAQVADTICSMN